MLDLLPEQLQSFIATVTTELWQFGRQTIEVLRWRYDLGSTHRSYVSSGCYYASDGMDWAPIPGRLTGEISIVGAFPLSDRAGKQVRDLVTKGKAEPLGHALFREAWDQKGSNPRSALLIGLAAIEVGAKECIGDLVPDARWLAENVPSPPMVRILREYLPTLPVRCKVNGKVVAIPGRIIELLAKGTQIRNRIAHVGRGTLKPEIVNEILVAVCDVLWLLDYCRGHEWAAEHISHETRRELGLE